MAKQTGFNVTDMKTAALVLSLALMSSGTSAGDRSQPPISTSPARTVAWAPALHDTESDQNSLHNRTCGVYASLFQAIAASRDKGANPEQGLASTEHFDGISLANRKKAVSLVYFDPAFTRLSGRSLAFRVFQVCLYGPPEAFQPPE
jgi:hypothetical protein